MPMKSFPSDTIVDVISYLLILLFVYTGASKLMAYQSFHTQIIFQPVIHKYAAFLSLFIPIIELLIATCLLIPRYRKTGLYAAFALMSIFTIYVGYMLASVPHNNLPCTCGGVLRLMTWEQHLVFNLVYTFLAFWAILIARRELAFRQHKMESL
jgi:uncharacterized membrane protein YphA (DoxX/SURF4 family)